MAQRFGAVACNADVHGSIPTASMFFYFFFDREINFFCFASCDTLDDP